MKRHLRKCCDSFLALGKLTINKISKRFLIVSITVIFLMTISCSPYGANVRNQDIYTPRTQENIVENSQTATFPAKNKLEIIEYRIGQGDVLHINVWQKVVHTDKQLAVIHRTQTRGFGGSLVEQQSEVLLFDSQPGSLEYAIHVGDVLQVDIWQKVRKLKKDLTANSLTLIDKEDTRSFEYTIDQGDVLNIDIWGHEDLKQQVTVRPEGKIAVALIGDIYVKGLTFDQLKETLIARFGEYIKNPVLSISLQKERDEKVSAFEKTFSRELIIRPDGKMSLPLAGDVLAVGLSFDQLKDQLTNRLQENISSPIVSIYLKQSRYLEESRYLANSQRKKVITLQETLKLEEIIRPDGRISIPLAGDVLAAGLTFGQLKEILARRLQAHIDYPVISISLKKLGGRKVIVLGEVNRPGAYAVTGQNTILEAISLAGGFTKDAVTSSAILIEGGLQNPVGRRLNLTYAINGTDMSQNVALQAEGIVYIPRTAIANVSYTVKQILSPVYQGLVSAHVVRHWDD